MAQILFIKPSEAPFVTNDESVLRRFFSLRTRRFFFKPMWRQAWHQLMQLIWLLRYLPCSRVIYIWFADYHALIPVLLGRLMRKKVIIVLGGYDVACLPDFNYGAHLQRFRSLYIRLCLRRASLLLPVSNATADELHHFPHGPYRVVYNGVDTDIFNKTPQTQREKLVLTVCGARDVRSARIKGIEYFVAAAHLRPDYSFLAIGLEGEALDYVNQLGVPKNLQLQGYVDRDTLISLYSKSKVCCQFSFHESFGMAVAEAMACECVPVVVRSGALPELVGDAGQIADARDAEKLAAAVDAALGADDAARKAIRQRMVDQFSLAKRQKELVQIISSMLEK